MRKVGQENFTYWTRNIESKKSEDEMASNLFSISMWVDCKTRTKRDRVKSQKSRRVTKDKKLWRAVIAHFLKGYDEIKSEMHALLLSPHI